MRTAIAVIGILVGAALFAVGVGGDNALEFLVGVIILVGGFLVGIQGSYASHA